MLIHSRGSNQCQRAGLTGAVERALRAPSVHNTQPWLWRIDPGVVDLHADWTRHLAATDPDRRDVLLSGGAALHHLRVSLAARGIAAHVHRLPNPENPAHLATIVVQAGTGAATAYPSAACHHSSRPHCTASHPGGSANPASSLGTARQAMPPNSWFSPRTAMSAVLLAATQLGLATTPLTQAIEVDITRKELQHQVLHIPEHPQLIIRIGWPATTAAELPPTPRRDLRSVLLPTP